MNFFNAFSHAVGADVGYVLRLVVAGLGDDEKRPAAGEAY